MILFFLRIFLVLLSLTGYLLLLHRKGIEAAFGPVLTVSGIGLTMYAAGLLNIMPLAAGVILLTGYAFFLGNLRKTAAFSSPKFLTVLLFFASLCVFLAFRLYGTEFSWVDNFTHWAVVVKDMLKTDHLPNFASSLVTFQSYPTGTAGVIYCFCKLIGETDHAMIWSQGVILASCLCVFWAFVKKPSFFSTAIILLASYYLLGMNISVSELCVDTLVSLLAIASFAVIFYYRSDRLKAAIFSCAIISYLVLVKNSALLFMLLHGILLLILEYSSHLVCDKNTSSTGCPPPEDDIGVFSSSLSQFPYASLDCGIGMLPFASPRPAQLPIA